MGLTSILDYLRDELRLILMLLSKGFVFINEGLFLGFKACGIMVTCLN